MYGAHIVPCMPYIHDFEAAYEVLKAAISVAVIVAASGLQ